MNSCGGVNCISQVISISNFSLLSSIVFTLWVLELFNLFDSD